MDPVEEPQDVGVEDDKIDILGLDITLIEILPCEETHPEASVYVTVYTPELLTVIVEEVSVVDHVFPV